VKARISDVRAERIRQHIDRIDIGRDAAYELREEVDKLAILVGNSGLINSKLADYGAVAYRMFDAGLGALTEYRYAVREELEQPVIEKTGAEGGAA